MNNSINVLLHGGLGNHLFQYAAAKTVAKKFENSNIKFFDYDQNPTQLRIENFIKTIKPIYFSSNRNPLTLIKRYFAYRLNCKLVVQKFPFTTNINDYEIKSLPITLDGYFPSPSWHQNSRSEVLKEMYEDRPKIFDKIIEEKNNVLAFRRSDYVVANAALNLRYYFEAMEKLKIEKKSTIILMGDSNSYLDEIEKAFISEGYKVKLSYKNKIPDLSEGWKDFFTMATSNKLIIASSTFQWWAATMRELYGLDPLNVCIPDPWYPKHQNYFVFCGNACNWITSNSYF